MLESMTTLPSVVNQSNAEPTERDSARQHLVRAAFALLGRKRSLLISDGQIGLIDLYQALELVAIRSDHRLAKAMQHRPCRLVAAQAQHPLQPQRISAMLLVGHVPGAGKPDPQRCSCLVEDRPSSHGRLESATPANQSASATAVRIAQFTAAWTGEPLGPA